jgi:hypothetical protein
MNTIPDNQSTGNPQTDGNHGDNPQPPDEALAAVLKWLRHYWDIPRQKAKWTEIATVVLILLTAIAAFWSAWIFEGQLTEMHTANVSAKSSSDEQIKSIKDQFRLDQRPYVWISSPTLAIPQVVSFQVAQLNKESPKQILISVHYTNFGKSPAVRVVQQHDIGLGHDALNKVKLKPLLQEFGTLLPAGKDDFFTVVSRPLKDEEIVQKDNALIPALLKDHAVAFRARFQFFDSSGYKYQTDVCMTRLQSGAFQYCPSGNAIKDCSKEQCE